MMTKRTAMIPLLLMVALGVGGCVSGQRAADGIHQRQAKADAERLAQTIEAADKVVLTEHSYPSDAIAETSAEAPAAERSNYEYARITLDAGQQQRLAKLLRTMEPKGERVITRCPFIPHHTLIIMGDRTESRLKICFTCSQVRWDVKPGADLDELGRKLAPWVRSMGMNPDADWKKRYQEARKAAKH